MKLKVSAGGVPPGSYMAEFVGVEPVEADAVRGYGEGLRWQFEVVTGPCKGQRASRITTANPTLKNACGKILAGLLGRPLAAGEEADLKALAGRNYLIVVTPTEGGGSKVESVAQPPRSTGPRP